MATLRWLKKPRFSCMGFRRKEEKPEPPIAVEELHRGTREVWTSPKPILKNPGTTKSILRNPSPSVSISKASAWSSSEGEDNILIETVPPIPPPPPPPPPTVHLPPVPSRTPPPQRYVGQRKQVPLAVVTTTNANAHLIPQRERSRKTVSFSSDVAPVASPGQASFSTDVTPVGSPKQVSFVPHEISAVVPAKREPGRADTPVNNCNYTPYVNHYRPKPTRTNSMVSNRSQQDRRGGMKRVASWAGGPALRRPATLKDTHRVKSWAGSGPHHHRSMEEALGGGRSSRSGHLSWSAYSGRPPPLTEMDHLLANLSRKGTHELPAMQYAHELPAVERTHELPA